MATFVEANPALHTWLIIFVVEVCTFCIRSNRPRECEPIPHTKAIMSKYNTRSVEAVAYAEIREKSFTRILVGRLGAGTSRGERGYRLHHNVQQCIND